MRNSIRNIDVFEVHLVGQTDTKQKYVSSIGDMCKNSKKVIWHYVLRRDLGVLNAPALRWLWFGGHKCAALEGEGP